jgi:hypothetical protein
MAEKFDPKEVVGFKELPLERSSTMIDIPLLDDE